MNTYLLICDNRYYYSENCAYMEYVCLGSEQEVRDKMIEQYNAENLDWWDEHELTNDSAHLLTDSDDEYSELIWRIVDCGEMPDDSVLVVRFGARYDDGHIESCKFMSTDDASNVLSVYEDMLDEWDEDYSEADDEHVYLTDECNENVTAVDVIDPRDEFHRYIQYG